MFPDPTADDTADDLDWRRRIRIGFALSHPTVIAGLALGAETWAGATGVAVLAIHGLVELQWHVTDRHDGPAGIPAASLYGPS